MKVLQLIDSLHPGGAEKMAITLSNRLVDDVEGSFLGVTREEGLLKGMINDSVGYFFARKKSSIDILAFMRLRKFIRKNKITVIHAHSSSYFWAALLRISTPALKIVWHDHYGNSEHLKHRKFLILKMCSRYISAIISVNEKLRDWAMANLKCEAVFYVKNFVSSDSSENIDLVLEGQKEFRIISLANLRKQKDHSTLLQAFKKIQQRFPMANLHLIGQVFEDEYYLEIKRIINELELRNIYIHGAQQAVHDLLKQGGLGVLSSISEGLPLALLEYGLAGLPVVATHVGQCAEVVDSFGKIVPPSDPTALANAIMTYFENPEEMKRDAVNFSEHVNTHYSFSTILPELMKIYST